MTYRPARSDAVYWSIGQVARRTGLSEHALRFYEREGLLLEPVERGSDGRRTYTESDLDWLELCIKLRSSGMPIAAIRRYTEMVRQGSGNEAQRLDILGEHQERIVAQLADLNACLQLINLKIEMYQRHGETPSRRDPLVAPPR